MDWLRKAVEFVCRISEHVETGSFENCLNTISMNQPSSWSGTILKSATRCNPLPAPGLEILSNIHLAQALFFLRLTLTLALVLAVEFGEMIPWLSI